MKAKASKIVAYIDGASRGNPGEASASAVLQDTAGRVLKTSGMRLGTATNNAAEYAGALLALQESLALGASELEIRTDSELLARQWNGEYRTKDATLKLLSALAKNLKAHFKSVSVAHVPREQNTLADREANRVLDGDLLI